MFLKGREERLVWHIFYALQEVVALDILAEANGINQDDQNAVTCRRRLSVMINSPREWETSVTVMNDSSRGVSDSWL